MEEMISEDLELQKQIQEKAENTLHETMWEGYANDIITGIGNNSNVKPNRAIWEMVQNARDVSLEGGKSKVVFTRKHDCFVFQHNGQPFNRKTIQSLILQTSSKVRQDIIQVGQYGTGFLTTHLFGLKFRLSSALKVLDTERYYYNFDSSELLIDRSCRDKKLLSQIINDQIDITQKWGQQINQLQDTPREHTVFTYLHEHDIERSNAAQAFETSPALVPYVLALNPYVESISFVDEIDDTKESFSYVEQKDDYKQGDAVVTEIIISHQKTDCNDETIDETISVFLLRSNSKKEEITGESLVTVILPLCREGSCMRATRLPSVVPQLFLYLPLLGTTEWGWNYVLHAPQFTCDKDSRDTLLFVGNGQNNDDQADTNRRLVQLSTELLRSYINDNYMQIEDSKYLCRVHFAINQPSQALSEYYKELQKDWVDYFENLRLVVKGSNRIPVSNIKVLDKETYRACQKDGDLLNAIYSVLSKTEHGLILPEKDDLLFWSETIDEWYGIEQNSHVLPMSEIVSLIEKTTIQYSDLTWLHKICLYIKENNMTDYFKKKILPNESLDLKVQLDLVTPAIICLPLHDVMKQLIPKEVTRFVHAQFVDIVTGNVEVYDNAKIRDALTKYLTNLSKKSNELKNAIINKQQIETGQFDSIQLESEKVQAILTLYHMLLVENASGFSVKVYNLLTEYYDFYPICTEKIDKDILDIRNCYSSLLDDSLLKFTLTKDKNNKADWCKRMVVELKSFSDANGYLRNYQVYPDQMGCFKYAQELKAENEGIPSRLKELYDVICRNVTSDNYSNSVKCELVSEDYAPYFIGESRLSGRDLSEKIEEPFKPIEGGGQRQSIEGDLHQDEYLEIIEHISDSHDGDVWRPLFPIISSLRPNLMLSVVTSPTKKESIFKIVKIKDEEKLRTIAKLSERDDVESLINYGEIALQQKEQEDYLKMLGDFVETHIQHYLIDALCGSGIDVRNEQGGQDLVLSKEGFDDYYVEIKSRWDNKASVIMSPMQFHKAVDNADRYSLISAQMWNFNKKRAEDGESVPFEEMESLIRVCDNIGMLEADLKKRVDNAFMNTEGDIHAIGSYKVHVPQELITKSFFELITIVKQYFDI